MQMYLNQYRPQSARALCLPGSPGSSRVRLVGVDDQVAERALPIAFGDHGLNAQMFSGAEVSLALRGDSFNTQSYLRSMFWLLVVLFRPAISANAIARILDTGPPKKNG